MISAHSASLARHMWRPGPWQSEADELNWTDDATGIRCAIRRGPIGALCGYVESADYQSEYAVHGGITFRGRDAEGASWIGFDCAHAGDFIPLVDALATAENSRWTKLLSGEPEAYKTIDFVREQVRLLASQVAERRGAA